MYVCMYYSYAPQELMVEIGDYGMGMTLILAGACKVIPGATDNTEPWQINSSDREPAFGLQSALPDPHWRYIREVRTSEWSVSSTAFVDVADVSRQNIRDCVLEAWPDETAQICDICFRHYNISEEWRSIAETTDHEPAMPTVATAEAVASIEEANTIQELNVNLSALHETVRRSQEENRSQMDRLEQMLQQAISAGGKQHHTAS